MSATVRLQKYLASCGIAARRKCEELILQKKVSVNGVVITQMGTCIDPEKDKVRVNGKLATLSPERVYYALNKPEGYVVTMSDSHGAPMVTQLLKNVKERIFPVGRLDMDTEGLLLLTNDGELANRLMHPRFHLEKEYIVTVKKELSEHSIRWLKKGILIDSKPTLPAKIDLLSRKRNDTHYSIIIREGRKRQIRRMFKAIGHPVIALKRVAIGPVILGRLPLGQYRSLTRKEIAALKSKTGMDPKK
ncbi:rRNA pseudouridine synthase [Candidatus Sumerlaeota bacterium]|nr:rRNA pseudouridine synthase [Candidatus Sumerlaeota bacterium]